MSRYFKCGHLGSVYSVAWSPLLLEQKIASGSLDHLVKIWDAETHECLSTLRGHTHGVTSVAWSQDSKKLASGLHDHLVKIWNTETSECLKTLKGHADGVSSVVWSPFLLGQKIASSSGYEVKIWDSEIHEYDHEYECLSTLGHESNVLSIVWSPDGQKIASSSSDHLVKIWDTQSHECLGILNGHSKSVWSVWSVWSVAWSPLVLGQKIASSSDDTTIKIWDVETYLCLAALSRHLSGRLGGVLGVAWSPFLLGQKIASGSWDNLVKIWDAENYEYFNKLKFID